MLKDKVHILCLLLNGVRAIETTRHLALECPYTTLTLEADWKIIARGSPRTHEPGPPRVSVVYGHSRARWRVVSIALTPPSRPHRSHSPCRRGFLHLRGPTGRSRRTSLPGRGAHFCSRPTPPLACGEGAGGVGTLPPPARGVSRSRGEARPPPWPRCPPAQGARGRQRAE